MATSIKITGGDKFKKYINNVVKDKMTLKVGFLEAATYPDSDKTVPEVAAQNEYGKPEDNIPPRPFMQQTFDKYSSKWANTVTKLMPENGFDLKKCFKLLGEIITAQIQHTISNGNFKPNAPMTIALKGKDTPLIDTAHMQQSVSYNVVTK